MEKARIGVVGLGMAGATAAMLLARQGHDVTVFEQAATPGAVGAGVLLQPSGQLVLERLGLLERVAEGAEPIERLTALTHRGRMLIDLPYGELGKGMRAYGVHRGTLFMTLYEALRGTRTELRTGVRAVRYGKGRDGTWLEGADGEPLGQFDFVVGCDGARSALREGSGISASVRTYPHAALWANGRCERVRGRLWQVTAGTRRMCGLLPTGEGQCSLFWSLASREQKGFYARGFEAWREEAIALCPESHEIFETVKGFGETRLTGYWHVSMRRPFDERCIFLGDAAHAMSPHLGQGINLAMIDGYCFARTVALSRNFAEACRAYVELRRAHLRVYAAVTYMLSPFFQSHGVVKGMLRDLVLPWMPRVGPMRRLMIMTMAGMRGGMASGRFSLPAEAEAAEAEIVAGEGAETRVVSSGNRQRGARGIAEEEGL